MIKSLYVFICSLLTLAAPCVVKAHGSVHERIDSTSTELIHQPDDVSLLIRRARLYLIDDDPLGSLPDLERVLGLEPESGEALLLYAGALLKAGRPAESLVQVRGYLVAYPDNAEALLIRARALAGCKRPGDSEAAYSIALSNISRPSPDLFLEQARQASLSGENGHHEALLCLEKGINTLGPLIVFHVEALSHELKLNDTAAALQRIDEILALGARQEEWLIRRAEILESVGRPIEAQREFRKAGQILQSRPDRIKRMERSLELAERAERGKRRTAERAVQ